MDADELIRLFQAGWSDTQIAEELGETFAAVTSARLRLDLRRRPPHAVTRQRREEVKAMILSGRHLEEVALLSGLSLKSVNEIRKKVRPVRKNRPPTPIATLVRLQKEGKTLQEIAAETGMKPARVRERFRAMGLRCPPDKRPCERPPRPR